MSRVEKYAAARHLIDMARIAPAADRAALIGLAEAQADIRLDTLIERVRGKSDWFSFSRVEENQTVYVNIKDNIGLIGGQTFDDFKEAIGDFHNVELFLTCSGGCSKLAFQIADLLLTRNVTANIVGRCCSAAVTIFLSAGKRLIQSGAMMMVHSPISASYGGIETHTLSIQGLTKLNARLVAWIASRTAQPLEIVNGWLNPPDKWFSAPEALSAGLATEICVGSSVLSDAREPRPDALPGCGDFPDESLFKDLLKAFPKFKVKSKPEFLLRLQQWADANIYE
jgi:ATP-dependent protease ClpP protease subunit